MRRSSILKILALAAIGLAFPAGARAENPYQKKYAQLVRVSDEISSATVPTTQMRRDIAAAYDALFHEVQPESVKGDIESLKILFDAANLTAFYSSQSSHAEQMEKYVSLLHDAGYVDMARGKDVYQAYIAAEAFSQARAFAEKYPHLTLPPLPTVIETSLGKTREEWVLDRTGESLASKQFSLPPGAFLIVVSSAQCHFSLASMAAIAKMADFHATQPRIKWLMRMERNFDAPALAKWNATYPTFRFSIARHPEAWSDITHWSTPNFYFFKDSVLVFKFSGWPAEGNLDLFDRGMKAAGFRIGT